MSAKWLKWTIAIASVAAGTAAVIGKMASDKKKEEELDDFLLPEETEETEYISVPSLTKDIQSWQDMDSEEFSVVLKFGFESDENAVDFQEQLAKEGLSSNYNADERIVRVEYNEDCSMEALNFLAATLEDACVECDAQYQGFRFL